MEKEIKKAIDRMNDYKEDYEFIQRKINESETRIERESEIRCEEIITFIKRNCNTYGEALYKLKEIAKGLRFESGDKTIYEKAIQGSILSKIEEVINNEMLESKIR